MASDPDAPPPPVRNLEFKARLLVLVMVLLVAGAALYLMYARGAFERTQQLVLIADDAEGVVAGMDLTFSGFPIGRVGHIELSPEGNARIIVNVPRGDAHWLRTSSVFTMVNGVVGGPKFRAFSGVLTDPPLPDGAERKVLRGDTAAEIPKVVASVRDLVANLSAITASDAPLGASLRSLQTTAERLNGPGGALAVILGSQAEAKKLGVALERTNTLLARLDGLVVKADGIAVKADGIAVKTDGLVTKVDAQVFGPGGVVGEARSAAVQLNALLTDARASLKKVDAVLVEAQGVAANTREATKDLASLRGEVDASLRKVEQLINEINRKWPFKRDTEIKLP